MFRNFLAKLLRLVTKAQRLLPPPCPSQVLPLPPPLQVPPPTPPSCMLQRFFQLNELKIKIQQIICNSSTRAELLKFVEEQSAGLSQDGSCYLKDSHSFGYQAITKELYIGNVYLRFYNDQPDSEITEPESFCLALVDFILHLVHNGPVAKVDSQVSGDMTTESSVEHPSSDDSSTSVDEKPTDRGVSDLIKNLQYALISLQHLLTRHPSLASVVSSKENLKSLFECFSLPVAPTSNVPHPCLIVLSRLTTYAPCLEAMVADTSTLLTLLQMLHSSPSCREGALHVLYALASTPELAWAAAKHGGVVFILEVLLRVKEEIPLQQRKTMHGPRVAIALARFFPDGLVSAIRDGPGEAVVSSLEQTTGTPELVWTPAMAASLSAQLATMASDLYREQVKGYVVDWDVPEQASGQQEMRDEPQVGGIYVRLFLKDPKFPLRNPKRFLEGLLDQYLTLIAATQYDDQAIDPKLPLPLSAALVSLLRVYPGLADHVGYLGYVPKLVSAVAYEASRETMASETYSSEDDNPQQNSQTPQEHVRLSCLRVLHQLAGSTTCAEAMAATSVGMPQVVPLLMKAIVWQGGSMLALETCFSCGKPSKRCTCCAGSQGWSCRGLLDWRDGGRSGLFLQMNWYESQASIGRVLAIEVLHAFATEEAYCAKVDSILNASDVCDILDFTCDPFEDEHPKAGLFSFKFAVRWPWSLKTAQMDQLQSRMYIHGIWLEMIGEDILKPNWEDSCDRENMILELNETLKQYEPYLLKYWPDLENPTSVRDCKQWVSREWYKHALPYGMRPRMFITYALALIQSLPHDFGITVGKPLTIGEASEQAKEELKKLVLFKEHIGADVYPEIFCVMNPKEARSPKILKEVRPHFIQVLVDGKVKLRLRDAPTRYKGKCNHHSNMVIMPSDGSIFM